MKNFEAALNLIEYTLEDVNRRDPFKPNIKNLTNALEKLLRKMMNENSGNSINSVHRLLDLQIKLAHKLLEKGIDVKDE